MQNKARKNVIIAVGATAAICLLIYLRALACDFVNLDDPVYVVNNRAIRQLDFNFLVSSFTKPYYFGWLPLTLLSFAVDYHFWELDPMGYHLTNILLHACNAGLVVLITDILCKLKFPQLAKYTEKEWLYPAMLVLAGLLFGLHPLRVESVAWVSQRKDVLNGLFSLGAVLFYLRHVHTSEPPGGGKKWVGRDYCISLGLFLFSLMAKQVSVVLPVMLLVIDWYPLGRIRKGQYFRILLEKLPFFILALSVSFLTIYFASKSSVMISTDVFPFYARTFVSGNALFEYCRLFLYPVGIQPYYIIGDELQTSFIIKTVAVVAATCACLYTARKYPAPAAVWFAFLLPLLPVLAFTQTADDTAFASRHTYLPSVSPCIAAGILFARWYQAAADVKKRWLLFLLPFLVTVVVIGYGALSLHLVSAWKNPGTLWTRQIEIQPLGRAYTFRGIYYLSTGRYTAALEDFASSIKIAQQAGREDIFNLYALHGEALRALGKHEEAIEYFTVAINLSGHPQYYYFRGASLKALGRVVEADEDFRRAGNHTGPILWFPAVFQKSGPNNQ